MGTIFNHKGMTGNAGGGRYVGGSAGDLQQYRDEAFGVFTAFEALLRSVASAGNFVDPRTSQPFTVVPFDFASGGWKNAGELFLRHRMLGPTQPTPPPPGNVGRDPGAGLMDFSSAEYQRFRSHYMRIPDPPDNVDGGPSVADVLGYVSS
jgi:hypothetical protein